MSILVSVSRACRRESGGARQGYMLTEVLVYIGLVFLLLGLAYAAMYRAIDNSVALRRNADDMMRALHAGELWRTDVRSAASQVRWVSSDEGPILQLIGNTNQVEYRFTSNAVYRRLALGSWSRILDNVKESSMERDLRSGVTACRWELELQTSPRGSYRPGRFKPLFTFLAVPPAGVSP